MLTGDTERFALANELHARPFPEIEAPCRAIFLVVRPRDGAARDPEDDRARLIALIDMFGGQHPAPGARHYMGQLGRFLVKWEAHTEFASYTIFTPGVSDTPFSGGTLTQIPADWLAGIADRIVTAAIMRIETADSAEAAEAAFRDRLAGRFAGESLAAAWVADGAALVATDFRLHEDGMARIAVIATPGVSTRRLGRTAQRLLEIESYKNAAMQALPVARRIAGEVSALDARLAALIADQAAPPRGALEALTALAAEIERLSAETSFRFGAAAAYEAIVNDRIAALRERRVPGRQLCSEFMRRRFDPAMRTCRAAERRLAELSDRVARASALLSTRVQVEVQAQNQALLESMNRRAALQLRLQQTVEGLSVVAISYYAVNLGAYLLAPAAKAAGLDKTTLTAALAVPVIGAVWLMVRRIRRHSE